MVFPWYSHLYFDNCSLAKNYVTPFILYKSHIPYKKINQNIIWSLHLHGGNSKIQKNKQNIILHLHGGNSKIATCVVARAGTAYSCCRPKNTAFDRAVQRNNLVWMLVERRNRIFFLCLHLKKSILKRYRVICLFTFTTLWHRKNNKNGDNVKHINFYILSLIKCI